MDSDRNFDSDRSKEFSIRFPKVISLINENIEKPFRPRGVINSAVLEAVMVSLLEHNKPITGKDLSTQYKALLKDKAFLDRITGGTTDTLVLKERLRIARDALSYAQE